MVLQKSILNIMSGYKLRVKNMMLLQKRQMSLSANVLIQEFHMQYSGGHYFAWLGPGKVLNGVLCPIWGTTLSERYRHVGKSPKESNNSYKKFGTCDIWIKDKHFFFWSIKEKSEEEHNSL